MKTCPECGVGEAYGHQMQCRKGISMSKENELLKKEVAKLKAASQVALTPAPRRNKEDE